MQLTSTPLTNLLLMLLVLPGQPQIMKGMGRSLDESGTCHCVFYMTRNSNSLQHLEELMSKYEKALSRVSEFAQLFEGQDNQVSKLVYKMQSSAFSSYEAPTFSQLRLELEEAQTLVEELKMKKEMKDSQGLFNQLQRQVANASFTLKLLSDSDQRSFMALRQEVDTLEGELKECEKMREKEQDSSYSGPPLSPGSCAHRGLYKVSKPHVVKPNWRGVSYKAGAWGRDWDPNANTSLYWVAPLRADLRYFDYYRLYKSYEDLMLSKNYKELYMGYGDGSGNAVYKNFMYFNYYGTNDMVKLDLSSNTVVLQRSLAGATYKNRFSYAGVSWKDIDFASDEKGLWVLYATEGTKGNLVVSRLNDSTLEVEKTWYSGQHKPAMSGAFMACGVLYALRPSSTRQEEIFYAFDTNTGQEYYISITLDKMLDTLQGINYSPFDHKLYVFNDAYLVTYDLTFLTRKQAKPFGAYALSKPIN
ncbi:PREDICTED: olfactomedin-4-like [Elephantulus edwardii]|uniref:olfactomedin-4-like n=1 Tax=Elephantulus edwardii TaxID=28737 RepID=UPI0003F0F260|nr:PREDICTED: olfactomedin-4-like [Elephantulus edwardii]